MITSAQFWILLLSGTSWTMKLLSPKLCFWNEFKFSSRQRFFHRVCLFNNKLLLISRNVSQLKGAFHNLCHPPDLRQILFPHHNRSIKIAYWKVLCCRYAERNPRSLSKTLCEKGNNMPHLKIIPRNNMNEPCATSQCLLLFSMLHVYTRPELSWRCTTLWKYSNSRRFIHWSELYDPALS